MDEGAEKYKDSIWDYRPTFEYIDEPFNNKSYSFEVDVNWKGEEAANDDNWEKVTISANDIRQIRAALPAIRDFAYFKHDDESGHTRSTINPHTGEDMPYSQHLNGVAHRATELHAKIAPEVLGCPVEIMQIESYLHDIVEDECVSFEELREILVSGVFPKEVLQTLRKKKSYDNLDNLENLSIPEEIVDQIIIPDLKALTKPDWNAFPGDDKKAKKKARDDKYYEELKKAPLRVKLVKLADNTHNMASLDGKGFLAALKGALKYRNSWSKIFTEKERLALDYINEIPLELEDSTEILQICYDVLEAVECGKNIPDLKAQRSLFERLFNKILNRPYSLDPADKLSDYIKKRLEDLKSLGFYSTNNDDASKIAKNRRSRGVRENALVDKLEESLQQSPLNNQKIANVVEEILFFIIETYEDVNGYAVVVQGIRSVLRAYYREAIFDESMDELVRQKILGEGLAELKELYGPIHVLDTKQFPLSPSDQGVFINFLYLERFFDLEDITGKDFMDMEQTDWVAMRKKYGIAVEDGIISGSDDQAIQ